MTDFALVFSLTGDTEMNKVNESKLYILFVSTCFQI